MGGLILAFSPVWAVGLVFASLGFFDWWQEYRFKKKSIAVKGKVVGKLSAAHKTLQLLGSGHDTSILFTQEVALDKGSFLYVEFETLDGKKRRVRSRKVFRNFNQTEIDVRYNPNDLTDVMIDSYYITGSRKYYVMFFGLFLIVSATIAFLYFLYKII